MRKLLIVPCVLILFAACKKSPHTTKKEIEKATQTSVEKILIQKKYQLDQTPSLEDTTLFDAKDTTHLVIFTPKEKGDQLLRHYTWPKRLEEPKLFFISIGNKKSQVMVIHGGAQKTVTLLDTLQFTQDFIPSDFDTTNVKMTKIEEKPNDEFLVLGKSNYRFNGMRWIPWQGDEIFPFVERFEVKGDESVIEITNRGEFASRVLFTLAFTDVNAQDIQSKLRLTKDIPTVNLYPPGRAVHKNGGGSVALKHPLIEIRKDAFQKNAKVKLPLFMHGIRHFTLRAVYSQRGQSLAWPSADEKNFIRDGQGYWAVLSSLAGDS